jgi:hypothetical protein
MAAATAKTKADKAPTEKAPAAKADKPAAEKAPAVKAAVAKPAPAVKGAVKGLAKAQAVVDSLDFKNTAGNEDLLPPPRQSKWVTLLDTLSAATVAEQVPRGEDGTLRFVKLGAFTNNNGARTQARAMENKGLGETYEFKSLTKGPNSSELWGRVIEEDDED